MCVNRESQRGEIEDGDAVTESGRTGGDSPTKSAEKKSSARTERSLISDEEFLR